MKYKRLLILVTILISITALVFCGTAILSVAEITVEITSVQNSTVNLEYETQKITNKYETKNLLFIKEDKLKKELEDCSGYIKVEKIKKEYPNRIFIKIQERTEYFTINYNSKFYMVDSEFKVLAVRDDNVNSVDGLKNTVLKITTLDFDENQLLKNNKLVLYDKEVEFSIKNSYAFLKNRRGDIKEVSLVTVRDGIKVKNFTFEMIEGMKINVLNFNVDTQNKLNALFDFYDNFDNKSDNLSEYYVIYSNGAYTVRT